MPRLLLDSEWYEPRLPDSLIAADYVSLVASQASSLYPGYILAKADFPVRNQNGSSKVAFALITSNYHDWWVGVAVAGAPPDADFVVQQARTLRGHKFDGRFVDAVAASVPAINRASLTNLIRREMPGVFVLLAHPPPPAVRDDRVRVGVLEVFESVTGRRILRINGDQPLALQEEIGCCERDALVPGGFLILDDKALASGWSAERIEIELGDVVTTWQHRPGTPWLVAVGPCPLPAGVTKFRIVRMASGRLRLLPA
jgi:hypothetical protein